MTAPDTGGLQVSSPFDVDFDDFDDSGDFLVYAVSGESAILGISDSQVYLTSP
jgi:hypothetical protein